ncbi:MAG: PBP1A family penicillin-binding protein [Candidatus Magasanikbacteria bacterium]
MKHKRPERRSYGYIDPDEPEQMPKRKEVSPRLSGIEEEIRPNRKKKPQESKRKTVIKTPFNLGILLFPLKATWAIVRGFFRALGWLWGRRPRGQEGSGGRFFKKIFSSGLILFVIVVIVGVLYTVWISRDLPDPDRLTDRKVAESTKIYDRTGETLLYEIFSDQKRTIIEFESIPETLIQAVIATEDTKFYEHHGIRPLSIIRAFVTGVFTKKKIAGTSTLTQQLVKNAILTGERSFKRKLKEAILSVRLEQKYTKDQILKIYFNEIPYGSTNYGVQAAAQSYFGKDVGDLELHELATLGGLPKAPSTYLSDREALKTRRNFVLRRMFEEGYISEEEKNDAQAKELTLERHFGDIKAPHFVLYVREKLVEEYGEQTVDTGGLKVITSLDWEKQKIAEKIIDEVGSKSLEEADADNTSLVAIEPGTGHILAMVGSKNFENEEIDGQFNVATLGKRQPGSSFKPIVYTAAFEKGYTPETILFDVITNFAASGRPYTPLNYDLKEHGPITIRMALQGSKNIPAVKTLYLVGVDEAISFARRLGYTTFTDSSAGLSLVLGGGEVKLLDHVAAFSVLANNGLKHEPVSILKVEDNRGDVLQEWKQENGERVLNSKITATISNVLSDDDARAYAFGRGSVLTLPGRTVAAKTGTTNNYVDAWAIGYTPSLAAGVWAGNTDNTPMKRGFGGSKVAGPIWNAFMREALEGTDNEEFPAPPKNDAEKAVLRGSKGGGVTLKIDKVTGKLASTSTPEKYIVERTYIHPHNILHYVVKSDPRGPIPKNPQGDPQYEAWERGIQDWIARKKEEDPEWDVSFEDPPTEYDDAHSLELIPTLEVVFPVSSSTLTSRQIDTDIRVSAKRGVEKVSYRLDGKYIGVIHEHPFNLSYTANELDPGAHTLTITVEDDVGNHVEENIPFLFEGLSISPGVSWVGENRDINGADTETTLLLNHTKLEKILSIDIFEQREEGEKKKIQTIDSFGNLFNNQIPVHWTAPELGNWTLSASTNLEGGVPGQGDYISLTVQ